MARVSRFARKIALRYLWSKRAEAFITIITVISILGVAIGVMVLTMVMAVMTGFQKELKDRILGANSHILVRSTAGHVDGWERVIETIQSIPGVKAASVYTQSPAFLRTDERATGILIRGIEARSASGRQVASYMGVDDLEAVFAVAHTDPRGQTAAQSDGAGVQLPAIVIGRELQRTLGVLIGSPISMLSSQVTSTPFGLIPKFRRFRVAGVYQSGLTEYESGLAYMPLADAQRFFGFGQSVSGVEVLVHHIDQAPRIADRISEALGGLSSGLYTQDWTRTNAALWEALALEKNAYFTVLLLIIIMASFSIITTLVMLVLEKRKDIAVLKTLGASSRAVGSIFFIQGATIGFLGTSLGLCLGVVGSVALREYGFPLPEGVFPVTTLPVRIEAWNFAIVGVAAFLICCLATIYPSLRASRLQPSEVLRYE